MYIVYLTNSLNAKCDNSTSLMRIDITHTLKNRLLKPNFCFSSNPEAKCGILTVIVFIKDSLGLGERPTTLFVRPNRAHSTSASTSNICHIYCSSDNICYAVKLIKI